jgi:hypothetical protein
MPTNPNAIDRASLERAARIYNSNREAGGALGVRGNSFLRACVREGIEAPSQRHERQRREHQELVARRRQRSVA